MSGQVRRFLSEKSKGMFGHVDLDSDEAGKGRGGFGFCAAEASCSGDVLVRPMLEAQREKDLGDEREVCALDEDVEVGEEEMECEDEELESEKSNDRLWSGQPSRRER